MNNLIWSPDSQHIGITLAGNYTGNLDPIGGSRVIDVATGEIIARYDWEPANALDGTFGGPVWISNEEFVVTLSLDQGPFFMTIEGEVTPILPLFDEEFNRASYWPPLEVFSEIEDEAYAILYRNDASGKSRILVRSGSSESITELEQSFFYQLYPNGLIGYQGDDGRFWTRPVFDFDAPFLQQAKASSPWVPNAGSLFVTGGTRVVTVFDDLTNETVDTFQFEGYELGFNLWPILSPDGASIAVFITEPKWGFGRALFVVPAPP